MAKAIRYILLAAALLAAPLTAAAEAKPHARASVINGTDATITDFPFQAALLSRPALEAPGGSVDGSQFCGAFVIDALHIGTAAHCVYDEVANLLAAPPAALKVLVGTHTLRGPGQPPVAGEDLVDVAAVSFRPAFVPQTFDEDAAVLTLTRPIDLTQAAIEAVSLSSLVLAPGAPVTVTGWGFTTPGDPASSPQRLQEGTVNVVADSDGTCGDPDVGYPGYVPSRMVCAAAPGTDSCTGDSGGPLAHMTSAGTRPTGWRLAGIVSFGDECASPTAAGVYSEVSTNPGLNAFDEFLTSSPPDAPRPTEPPDLRGNAVPGESVECHSGWSNATAEELRIRRTRPTGFTDEAPTDNRRYTISSAEVGWKLACVVKATGPGGYGRAVSADVTVSAPAPAPPSQDPPPAPPSQPAPPVVDPPKPADMTRPTTRLVRRRCSRTQCSLQVQVTDPPYTSGIRSLLGSGSLEYRSRCRRNGRTRVCTRKRKLSVKPVLLGAGRYSVRVRSRTPGLATLRFVAYDVAGNRQARAAQIRVRFGPRP